MFIRQRAIQWMVFNQPPVEGGGSGDQQSQDGSQPPAGQSQEPAAGNQSSAGASQEPYKAPWEKNGTEFDADKARNLLANKEADEKKLKERLAEFERAQQEAEDAKLSDQQRIEKERDEAKSASEKATLEAARLRALVKFGLSEEDLEFIHGSTEEEVLASAERYSERHGSSGTPLPSNRPRAPRGGGNPSATPEESDPMKLAEGIPRN